MAPEPLNEPEVAAFPASKIAPFLRAMADPEGKGGLPREEEAVLRRIEANVAEWEAREDRD